MAEPTTTPAPSVGRAAFTFILIMVALDFLAFGIIVPVLPDLIRSFEGRDFARASAITGYFGFAWNAMQFFFRPSWAPGRIVSGAAPSSSYPVLA